MLYRNAVCLGTWTADLCANYALAGLYKFAHCTGRGIESDEKNFGGRINIQPQQTTTMNLNEY